jgi:hypothetical protein
MYFALVGKRMTETEPAHFRIDDKRQSRAKGITVVQTRLNPGKGSFQAFDDLANVSPRDRDKLLAPS